jgi:hypothetical protein
MSADTSQFNVDFFKDLLYHLGTAQKDVSESLFNFTDVKRKEAMTQSLMKLNELTGKLAP